MASNRVVIQVDLVSDAAQKGFEQLNKQIGQIGTNSEKATRQGAEGIKRFGVEVEHGASSVKELAEALAGLEIVKLGAEMIKTGDEIRRATLALEAMTGSAEQAGHIVDEVRKIAAQRVFSFPELLDAARRMKAFGFATEEIPRDIAAISKAIQNFGGDAEMIEQMTHALGVMREKGVASAAQLFRQLAARGLPVMDILREELKEQTGKIFSTAEIRNFIEKGELAGEATAEAMIRGMEKLADTSKIMDLPTSRLKLFQDALKDLSASIDKDVSPSLNAAADAITAVVKGFNSLPPWARKLVEGGVLVGGGIAAGGLIKRSWQSDFLGMASAINLGKGAVTGTIDIAKQLKDAAALAKTAEEGSKLVWFGKLATTIPLVATSLQALAIAITAVATAVAGFKLGEWIDKNIAKYPWLVGLLAAQGGIQFGMAAPMAVGAWFSRQDQIRQYEAAHAMRTPEADKAYKEAEEKRQKLLQPPEGLLKEQMKEAEALYARAQESLFKGISAIRFKEQAEIAKMRTDLGGVFTNPAAEKRVHEAYAIEIQKTYEEMFDKLREENLAATKEELQNHLDMVKEATSYEAEMAMAVIRDTPAKQAQAEEERMAIIRRGAEEERAARLAIAENIRDDAVKTLNDMVQKQVQSGRLTAMDRIQLGYYATEELKKIDRDYNAAKAKADIETAKEVARAEAEIVRQSAEETTRIIKETRDAQADAELAHMERQIEIQRAMILDGEAQTARDKIAQLEKAYSFEVQAAQRVSAERRARQEDDLQARIDALNEQAQVESETGDEVAQNLWRQARELEEQKKNLGRDAILDMADFELKTRLDTQREINRVWIEEQKQVFEKFESGVSKVMDALFQRGKSLWKSLADMAFTAAKDMMKAAIVPAISASLMSAAGMPVHMEQKGDFGPGWFGRMAGYLNQRPVFAPPPSKLEAPGHVGDWSRDYPLPVTIQGDLPTQKVHHEGDVTVHGSVGGAAGPSVGPAVIGALSATMPGGGFPGWSTNVPPPDAARQATEIQTIFRSEGGGYAETLTQTPGYTSGGGYVGGTGGAGGGFSLGSASLGNFGAYGGNVAGLMQALPLAGSDRSIANLVTLAAVAKSGGLKAALMAGAGPLAVLGGIMGMKGAFSLGQFLQNRNVNPLLRAWGGTALGATAGMLTFGGLMAMFPMLAAAGPFGLIAAGVIGATIGLIGAFKETDTAHARKLIKQFYGIDIPNQQILAQVVGIAKQRYGGAISMAVASPEVQQLVSLYAASQGVLASGMPRPMYPATFTQSAAGLQLQPVYQNGMMVPSPYAGTTTTQWANAAKYAASGVQDIYVQLDPRAANALFTGQVVNVMNQNPTVIGNANAAAINSGSSRNAQLAGLMEPFSVTA